MSIIGDREEPGAAKARLAAMSEDQLQRDPAYWSMASRDHVVEFNELANRRASLQDLYVEEQAWVGLITDELRARRKPAVALVMDT